MDTSHWTKLVDEMSRKISSAVGPKETALLINQAVILCHFDNNNFCSSVWGDCNLALSNKLQKRQKLIGLPW